LTLKKIETLFETWIHSLHDFKRVSRHKARKQSTSHNEEMSLTALTVNCVTAVELEESIRQSRGLIPIRRKQSKYRNKCVNMGEHERLKSRIAMFTNKAIHSTVTEIIKHAWPVISSGSSQGRA